MNSSLLSGKKKRHASSASAAKYTKKGIFGRNNNLLI
jgi:hypothetical protein